MSDSTMGNPCFGAFCCPRAATTQCGECGGHYCDDCIGPHYDEHLDEQHRIAQRDATKPGPPPLERPMMSAAEAYLDRKLDEVLALLRRVDDPVVADEALCPRDDDVEDADDE